MYLTCTRLYSHLSLINFWCPHNVGPSPQQSRPSIPPKACPGMFPRRAYVQIPEPWRLWYVHVAQMSAIIYGTSMIYLLSRPSPERTVPRCFVSIKPATKVAYVGTLTGCLHVIYWPSHMPLIHVKSAGWQAVTCSHSSLYEGTIYCICTVIYFMYYAKGDKAELQPINRMERKLQNLARL